MLFGLRFSSHAQTPTPTPTPTPTCTTTPTATPIQTCPLSVHGPCATPPCPASPYPTATVPPATPIPDAFQTQDANSQRTGVVLQWRVYQPTSGGPTWPVAIIFHEGGFYTGFPFSGSLMQPAADLQKAGYYTLVADYPLAPCGLIQGQACHDDPTSGRPPQQTDAVKAIIRAARADLHCKNFQVVVIGGSSGASHAAFAAFDTGVVNVWPYWNSGGHDDRPDVIVCLSGAYDFADRTPENYQPNPLIGFQDISRTIRIPVSRLIRMAVRAKGRFHPSTCCTHPRPTDPSNQPSLLIVNMIRCRSTKLLIFNVLYRVCRSIPHRTGSSPFLELASTLSHIGTRRTVR